jgi:hypothetical protein
MKGCPFCGGKGSVERLRLEVPNPYRVRCDDCRGASGWRLGRERRSRCGRGGAAARAGGGGCVLRMGGTPMRGIEMRRVLARGSRAALSYEALDLRHKWLVEQVRGMREMQRAPSVLVRDGKRKAVERAVDGYIESCKEDANGGK